MMRAAQRSHHARGHGPGGAAWGLGRRALVACVTNGDTSFGWLRSAYLRGGRYVRVNSGGGRCEERCGVARGGSSRIDILRRSGVEATEGGVGDGGAGSRHAHRAGRDDGGLGVDGGDERGKPRLFAQLRRLWRRDNGWQAQNQKMQSLLEQ